MRIPNLGLLAGLASFALAEDLLFIDTLKYEEYNEATGPLALTAKVVTETEWRAMKTEDFAKFKAIVISDPSCVGDPSGIQFLEDTKDVWGPAVMGNMILIGMPTFPVRTALTLLPVSPNKRGSKTREEPQLT